MARRNDTVAAAQAKKAEDVDLPKPSAGAAADQASKMQGQQPQKRQSKSQKDRAVADAAQAAQEAETAELLQTLQVLGSGATQAIDGLLGILDKMYEPAIEEIVKKTGASPPSMKLRDDEKELMSFTLERVVHKMSPEFVAKYGIWLLVGLTTVTIGLPRVVIGMQLNKLTKEILQDRANQKKQRDATAGPKSANPAGPPPTGSDGVIPGADGAAAAD